MRRATQNVAVVADGDNILLSFGFDFCAEHEWGTAKLKRTFGVSDDKEDLTVQRYAVTAASSDNLWLFEAEVETTDYDRGSARKKKHRRLYLLGGDVRPYKQTLEDYAVGYHDSWPNPEAPQSHWDERAFLFSVPTGGEHEVVLRAIHAAMLAGDALLYQAGGRNPFGGAGLVIVRRSTIPHGIIARMEAGFCDAKELQDAAAATGIRARIEEWGRTKERWGSRFYALSPAWVSEDRRKQTKHPVMFWLNPTEQDRNNYGWFTVEELEQWMEGKGPIPKRAAA